jgi:hypothetical protein
MANKFGYSGSLGYNSYKMSRGGNCCCPEKGDRGTKGDQGFQGIKGDTGPIGPKGETGSGNILHGLFICDNYTFTNPSSALKYNIDISSNLTTSIGDRNFNFVNENPLTSNTLITFSDLSNNFTEGMVEFYISSGIDSGGANGPVYTFDLSGVNIEPGSNPGFEIDTRSTGKTTGLHNVAFGPISYRVSSTINNEIISFNNTYKLRLTITSQISTHTINNTRLVIKFRPLNP